MSVNHLADDGGVAAKRMLAHSVEHGFRHLWHNESKQLPFVGNIQRIEAENFAGAFDRLPYGDGTLVNNDANIGVPSDLIEGGCAAAAGGIAVAAILRVCRFCLTRP